MIKAQRSRYRCSEERIRHNPALGITTKVMRCKFVYARLRGGLPHNLPQHFRRHSGSTHAPSLGDGSEQRTFSDAAGILPFIDCRFYPPWDWHSTNVPGLAQQVGDNPVSLAQLDGISSSREQLAASQS